MTTSTISLFDWILNLFRDPAAREAFQADPERYAAEHGFENLSAADVHDALCLNAETADELHLPPPRDYHHGEDAPRYLDRYIDHYKVVEKHTTNIDNSIHQTIDTGGGDFDQTLDIDPVVASGDGAVAANGDIRDSTVTSGDGSIVGDDNHALSGDDNITAFGSGDANGTELDDARFGEGAAVSVGGDARGDSTDSDTDTSVHSDGDGDTAVNAAGPAGYAQHDADQHESDTSTHNRFDDSSNTDSHNAYGSHNSVDYQDSHDYDAHSA